MNPTRSFLPGQTQPSTCQLAGLAGFAEIHLVHYPVQHFRLVYLWLHSYIQLLIIKYSQCHLGVLSGCSGHPCHQKMERDAPFPIVEMSVNTFRSCILGNLSGHRLQIVITEVLARFIGKTRSDMLPAPSWKWASTERQQFEVWHLR